MLREVCFAKVMFAKELASHCAGTSLPSCQQIHVQLSHTQKKKAFLCLQGQVWSTRSQGWRQGPCLGWVRLKLNLERKPQKLSLVACVVVPVLKRVRQEDYHKFEDSLCYLKSKQMKTKHHTHKQANMYVRAGAGYPTGMVRHSYPLVQKDQRKAVNRDKENCNRERPISIFSQGDNGSVQIQGVIPMRSRNSKTSVGPTPKGVGCCELNHIYRGKWGLHYQITIAQHLSQGPYYDLWTTLPQLKGMQILKSHPQPGQPAALGMGTGDLFDQFLQASVW